MKGIDLTQEQLYAAAAFIRGRMINPAAVSDDHLCQHYFRDLVRLVAWYGTIRYQAALRNVCNTKFTREEFPIPCVLPQEICEQILADERLGKPGPVENISSS